MSNRIQKLTSELQEVVNGLKLLGKNHSSQAHGDNANHTKDGCNVCKCIAKAMNAGIATFHETYKLTPEEHNHLTNNIQWFS